MSNVKKLFRFLPYWLGWSLQHKKRKTPLIDFYCDNVTDFICFKKVLTHFPEMRVIAKNPAVQAELKSYNIDALLYPSYPDVVIMCRHSAWRYPLPQITKIGMRHGPYHFKDFIKAEYYNEFDHFFFTSPDEASQAEALGIRHGAGPGFPKLDDAFDGTITNSQLEDLKKKIGINSHLPTVIFSATWSEDNYSAILKWYQKVSLLTKEYNVLVTVHEWTPQTIKDELSKNEDIYYLEDKEVLPYLILADVMIGDTSSIIAEFTALDKPVITFRIPAEKRISREIVQMLDEITFRVDSFEEMKVTLKQIFTNKQDIHKVKRVYYNEIMFGKLDGKASLRIRDEIKRIVTKQ